MLSSLVLLLSSAAGSALALNNGLATTPQMGWNTWNYHACEINSSVILDAASAIKQRGLDQLGYKYVVIDDCWQAAERDSQGRIPADPQKWPGGLKNVTDAVHQMGLLAGIYSSAGVLTCGRRLGSLDHEEVDANSWAEAGFDYLKYDNCFNQGRAGTPKLSFDRYNAMGEALNKTGRAILYSACNWGEDGPWNFGSEIFNSWRMSGDVANSFDRASDYCPCESTIGCQLAGFHCNIRKIINMAAPLGQKAGPGRWNDLDMLQVGNGALNRDESITHFSLWSALKSPLILGNDVSTDLTRFSNESLAIVANEHVIAVNQDPLGTPAERILNLDSGTHQIWTGPLTNGSYVVAMVNFAEEPWTRTLTLADIFYDAGKEDQQARSAAWNVYDLWAGVDYEAPARRELTLMEGSPFRESLAESTIPPHGTVMLRLTPAEQ